MRRAIEHTDEGDFRVFEGTRTPIMTLDNLAGKKPEEFTLNVRKLEDQRSGAGDPADADPGHGHSTASTPRCSTSAARCRPPTPRCASSSVRGYNRWLSDYASHAPDRLLGVAAIPIDTPERAVEEIGFAGRAAGPRRRVHPAVPARGANVIITKELLPPAIPIGSDQKPPAR